MSIRRAHAIRDGSNGSSLVALALFKKKSKASYVIFFVELCGLSCFPDPGPGFITVVIRHWRCCRNPIGLCPTRAAMPASKVTWVGVAGGPGGGGGGGVGGGVRNISS